MQAPERDVPLNSGISRGSTRGGLFDSTINPEDPMEPRSGDPFAPISDYPGINPHYLSGSEHAELSGRFAPPSGVLRTRMSIGNPPLDEFGRVTFAPERMAKPPETMGNPINFPEARKFYTNVSDVTKRPGFMARQFEDSGAPRMRREAGGVRDALHQDLTDAAGSVGRGQDYQNAIDEYARAAKMVSMAKKAGLAGAGTAAGSLGAGKLWGLAKTLGGW